MVRKLLFLCAHNQSRSVTAEGLVTGEKGFEVRSRALWKGTNRKVTKRDGEWADEVYVMMPGMIPVAVESGVPRSKIKSLWVPDTYIACEKELISNLRTQLAHYKIYPQKNTAKAQRDCEKILTRKLGGLRGIDFEWGVSPEWRVSSSVGAYNPDWNLDTETIKGVTPSMLKEIEAKRELDRKLQAEAEEKWGKPPFWQTEAYKAFKQGQDETLLTEEAKAQRDWNREFEARGLGKPVTKDVTKEKWNWQLRAEAEAIEKIKKERGITWQEAEDLYNEKEDRRWKKQEAKLQAEFEASEGIPPKGFDYWEDLEEREAEARKKDEERKRMTKKEQQEKEMLEALEKYTESIQKLFDTQ